MADTYRVLVLGGDGIGPEVTAAAVSILTHTAHLSGLTIEIEEDLLGGAAYDRHGVFCTDQTLDRALGSHAVLVGAVGGPNWDGIQRGGTAAEQDGLMRLRQALAVYAGLRPARHWPSLTATTPFKPGLADHADVIVVRELCGGAFFAEPRGIEPIEGGGYRAFDTNLYTTAEIERIARVAFELAGRRRGQVTSIDKANVMESYVLWRQVVETIGQEEYPDIELEVLYADNAAYQLMRQPAHFDVILGDNLFGDLFSDLAGTISGSLGMLPSASLPGFSTAEEGLGTAIYEPVHGSAPEISGRGIANPMGAILSVAMMYEFSFGRPDLSRAIERAVELTLDEGFLTPDVGGTDTTASVTARVIDHLATTVARHTGPAIQTV
ncbi:MAG: 3-isopropylmalate dehydrogenase [Pseudomonadota bacterium]|nr:3-isopropylmalate dehydrogenase [Pseudomonadota bacterium]